MNTEQERADFEWWASDEGENPRAVERVGECYKLAQIQSYWMAWQARAVLQSPEEQALRKDAERYRFLREIGDDIQWENLLGIQWGAFNSTDSAVDTAMEKQK